MGIRRTSALIGILLTMTVLTCGCDNSPQELIMEVPTPKTAFVGRNADVQVIFRNLPEEGCDIDMIWNSFGTQGEQREATIGTPPSPGFSGNRKRLQLVWTSSNASILGGQMEMPTFSGLNGKELRPGDRDINFEFHFEALSSGRTDLLLALTKADGSVTRKKVKVIVTE